MTFAVKQSAHVLAGLLIMLGGCSSVGRNIAFSGGTSNAFALIAADGMVVNGSNSYDFILRKVDIATSSFSKEELWVNFSGMGPIAGDEFQKPEDVITLVRFGGKETPAGDYALVARNDYMSLGTYNSTTVNCFSKGAIVFRLDAEKINLIPLGHTRIQVVTTAEISRGMAEKVLSSYPKMTAPVVNAPSVGSITFDTSDGWLLGNKTCNLKADFAFSPRETTKLPASR